MVKKIREENEPVEWNVRTESHQTHACSQLSMQIHPYSNKPSTLLDHTF